ncbi:MAG: hypothetical protein HN417_07280 [Desulfobacula sp.]|nr:hypothetical protein [Desulfobacula sp.]
MIILFLFIFQLLMINNLQRLKKLTCYSLSTKADIVKSIQLYGKGLNQINQASIKVIGDSLYRSSNPEK